MEQQQLRLGHNDSVSCHRIANQAYDGQHYACIIIETTSANVELPAVIDTVDYALDGSWTILDVSHF